MFTSGFRPRLENVACLNFLICFPGNAREITDLPVIAVVSVKRFNIAFTANGNAFCQRLNSLFRSVLALFLLVSCRYQVTSQKKKAWDQAPQLGLWSEKERGKKKKNWRAERGTGSGKGRCLPFPPPVSRSARFTGQYYFCHVPFRSITPTGAVVAQLASARLSEREVPGSILGDLNVCFDFLLSL